MTIHLNRSLLVPWKKAAGQALRTKEQSKNMGSLATKATRSIFLSEAPRFISLSLLVFSLFITYSAKLYAEDSTLLEREQVLLWAEFPSWSESESELKGTAFQQVAKQKDVKSFLNNLWDLRGHLISLLINNQFPALGLNPDDMVKLINIMNGEMILLVPDIPLHSCHYFYLMVEINRQNDNGPPLTLKVSDNGQTLISALESMGLQIRELPSHLVITNDNDKRRIASISEALSQAIITTPRWIANERIRVEASQSQPFLLIHSSFFPRSAALSVLTEKRSVLPALEGTISFSGRREGDELKHSLHVKFVHPPAFLSKLEPPQSHLPFPAASLVDARSDFLLVTSVQPEWIQELLYTILGVSSLPLEKNPASSRRNTPFTGGIALFPIVHGQTNGLRSNDLILALQGRSEKDLKSALIELEKLIPGKRWSTYTIEGQRIHSVTTAENFPTTLPPSFFQRGDTLFLSPTPLPLLRFLVDGKMPRLNTHPNYLRSMANTKGESAITLYLASSDDVSRIYTHIFSLLARSIPCPALPLDPANLPPAPVLFPSWGDSLVTGTWTEGELDLTFTGPGGCISTLLWIMSKSLPPPNTGFTQFFPFTLPTVIPNPDNGLNPSKN